MLSVEGLCQRVANGTGLEVVRKHRRPSDRLQQGPVRAEGDCKRENDKNFTEANKHKITLVQDFTMSTEIK